jgi:predicted nucleotidyltransferase
MVTLETLRREKKAEILRLADTHGCRNVRVFGSVATGENNFNSDIDFLVDLDRGRGLLDLGGLLSGLHDLLGVDIDLIESESIHPYIRDRVLSEAVPL